MEIEEELKDIEMRKIKLLQEQERIILNDWLDGEKWAIHKGFLEEKARLRKKYHEITPRDNQSLNDFEKFCDKEGLKEPTLNEELTISRIRESSEFKEKLKEIEKIL